MKVSGSISSAGNGRHIQYKEGIALIKQENEINKKLNIAQWKFIEEHPEKHSRI